MDARQALVAEQCIQRGWLAQRLTAENQALAQADRVVERADQSSPPDSRASSLK